MTITLDNISLNVPIVHPSDRFIKKLVIKKSSAQSKQIIKNICFKFDAGFSYALIGANGSGKTTLLKLMMGIYYPTVGVINVEGSLQGTVSTLAGYNPEFSIYDNILIKALTITSDLNNARKIADEVIAFARVDADPSQPFKILSNGNQLKLGFSFATASNADNLLMDEVVTVGDYRFIENASHRLKNYLKNSKLFILCTHNETMLREFCSHGVVLKNGKIVYNDSLSSCLNFYHSKEYDSL